mgnify:FL=1
MPLYKIFPTIIESFHDKEFTDKVLPISEKILKDRPDSHYGYKNTHRDTTIEDELYSHSFIPEYLHKIANKFLETLQMDCHFPLNLALFTREMEEGDTHGSHIHHNCIFSGVCYLKVPPNSAPITFEDGKDARCFNGLQPKVTSEFNSGIWHYEPQEGDILIWESWVHHAIYSNQSSDRKTLVFNFYR